jgi:rhamnogalacturonyl hydrolase YesR
VEAGVDTAVLVCRFNPRALIDTRLCLPETLEEFMRRRLLIPAAGLTATVALAGTAAVAGWASAGSTATPPKPAQTKAAIIAAMSKADNYWVAHGTDRKSNNWKNATFHVGNLAFVTVSGTSNHVTRPWAQANKFALPKDKRGPFFPDTYAPGEVYLDLLAFHPDETTLTALRAQIKANVANVAAGHVDTWNYVDALNMAMPEFARIGVKDNSPATLDAMQQLFNYTEKVAGGHGLFSEADGLWWRDAKYVDTKTYWSRGNGWAAMALAKVLQALPVDDPRSVEYQRVLRKMAAKLATIQRSDGFWNVDLGNAGNFPGPETTGTAMFTYALTWGINHKVLDAATYRPVVENAWQGMVAKALQSNGKLGYCQGTGQRPSDGQPVTVKNTSAVGVGAFLLAGSQLATLEG